MNSRIIGRISFDEIQLAADIQRIISFPDILHTYTEFSFGQFSQHVLWNESGSIHDTVFHEIASGAVITEYGAQLPYVRSLVERLFVPEAVQMVRANLMHTSILHPHRDYTELDAGSARFVRLHIPLHTHHSCKHSDTNTVYHMASGEIWFLDAGAIHAAYSPTPFPRISLCIDLKTEGRDLRTVFRDASVLVEGMEPLVYERQAMDGTFMEGIRHLIEMVCEENLMSVMDFLSRVHFYRDVPVRAMYDWINTYLPEDLDAELRAKIMRMEHYYIGHRGMNERFSFWDFEAARPLRRSLADPVE